MKEKRCRDIAKLRSNGGWRSANKHKVTHSLWIRLKWFYFIGRIYWLLLLLQFKREAATNLFQNRQSTNSRCASARRLVESFVIMTAVSHSSDSIDPIQHLAGKRIESVRYDEHRWHRTDKWQNEKKEPSEHTCVVQIFQNVYVFLAWRAPFQCAFLSCLYQFDLHMRAVHIRIHTETTCYAFLRRARVECLEKIQFRAIRYGFESFQCFWTF